MTMAASTDVLESLKVEISADINNLRAELENVIQATRAAGQSAGQAFGDGMDRTSKQWASGMASSIKQGIDAVRNEMRAGITSNQQFAASLRYAEEELQDLVRGVQRGSAAYQTYVRELADVRQELARVDAAQDRVNANHTRTGTSAGGLGTQFASLRTSIQGVVAAAAAWAGNQVIRELGSMAQEADAADKAVTAFGRTVARMGLDNAAATKTVDALADRFGVMNAQAYKSAETLLRNGASIQQVKDAFTAAGASAAREGKNIGEAWDAVSTALVTGRSELLESYGLITNLGPAYQQYKKEIGAVGRELTDQERITAGLNAILRETKSEVQDVDIYLQGLSKTENDNLRIKQELRNEIGRAYAPALAALREEQNRAMQSALDWAQVNKGDLKESFASLSVVIADVWGAIKVLVGVGNDLAHALGGVLSVTNGLTLAFGGGVMGGLRTGINEMTDLFKLGIESIGAFTKAFDQLKAGDFTGAWKTITDAQKAVWGAVKAIPSNIVNGAQQSAAFGAGLMQEGWNDITSFGNRTSAAISSADASSSRVRNAVDGVVKGQEIITALGMVGRSQGAAYGSRYNFQQKDGKTYSGVHNGVDFFAPAGTPVLAPFTGQIQLHEDAKNGKWFEMVDALGQRAAGLHLSSFTKALEDAVRRAPGGKLIITAGTQIGGVGDTGNLSQGNHLHFMSWNAQGQYQNPLTAGFKSMDSAGAWMGAGSPPPPQPPQPTSSGPVTAAMIARARELVNALEAAKKAAKADPGNDTLAAKLAQANTALTNWTKGNDAHAAALKAVQEQQQKNTKAAGEYIATAADFKQYGNTALRLYKDLERAQEGGNAEQIAFAKQAISTWQGTSEAKKAVYRDEVEAYNLRKKAADEAARDQKRLDEEAKRRAEQAQKQADELARKANTSAQEAARLRRESLEQSRNDAVKAAGNDLAAVLAVQEAFKPRIIAAVKTEAEAVLAARKRANDQWKAEQEKAAHETLKGAALTSRLSAINKAWADENSNAYRAYYATVGKAARDGAEAVSVAQKNLSDALTQGNKDAEDALANLDQYLQGSSEAARAAAQNTPQQFTLEQIITLLPESADKVDQFRKILSDFNREGLITDQVMTDALRLIPEFGGAVGGIGAEFAETEARLEAQAKRLDDLKQQYDEGQISSEDYRDSLYTLADSYHLQAEAAKRANDPGLVRFFQEAEQAARNAAAAFTDYSNALPDAQPTRLEGARAYIDALNANFKDGTITAETYNREVGQLVTDLEQWAKEEDAKDNKGLADSYRDLAKSLIAVNPQLKALYDQIENPPTPEEVQSPLEGTRAYVESMIANFRGGTMTPEAFAAASGQTITGLLADAKEEDKKQNYGLAESYRALARSLIELNPQLKALYDQIENGPQPDNSQTSQTTVKDQMAALSEGVALLTSNFDDGLMTAEQYSQALRDEAGRLDILAAAAQRVGNVKLAEKYREEAQRLREMTPEALKAAEALNKFNTYAGYVQQLAGAFGKLAEATGKSDLGANLNGLGNMVGQIMNMGGDIAKLFASGGTDIGAWVGLISKVVTSIADALAGFQKARAEVKKLKEDFAEANPFLNAGDYQKTFTRSRGILADLFGGGPEVVNEIDKVGLRFAQSMAGAFSDGLSSGLRNWMQSGDVNDLRKTLYGSVYEATFGGLIESFKSEVLKDIIAPAIKLWSDALKTPGREDDAAALNALREAARQAASAGEKWGAQVMPELDQLRRDWGLDSGAGAGSASGNYRDVGTAPIPQLGIPRIEFQFPADTLAGFQNLNTAAPIFLEGSRTLLDAARQMLASQRGGSNGPPPLSGLGSLT